MSSVLWQQELERWLLAHLSAITLVSTRHRQGEYEGGAREYRADDRVWAGQMTGQHGPVLRFMRHDAHSHRGSSKEEEKRSGKKAARTSLKTCAAVDQFFSSDALQERTLVQNTPYARVSVPDSRLFHAGGLRTS